MITFKENNRVIQESETLTESFVQFISDTAKKARTSSRLVVEFAHNYNPSDIAKLACFLSRSRTHSYVKLSIKDNSYDLVDWTTTYIKKIINDALTEKKWNFIYIDLENTWDVTYVVKNIRFIVHITFYESDLSLSMQVAKVERIFDNIFFKPILQTKRLYELEDDIETTLKTLIKTSYFFMDTHTL